MPILFGIEANFIADHAYASNQPAFSRAFGSTAELSENLLRCRLWQRLKHVGVRDESRGSRKLAAPRRDYPWRNMGRPGIGRRCFYAGVGRTARPGRRNLLG